MNPERKAAIKAGEMHYTGTPCKHGHQGARYTSNGACVACQLASSTSWKRRVRAKALKEKKKGRVKWLEISQ